MTWLRKSPWVTFFNSGGCNGCILETLAIVTPRYDIERFGCVWKTSARHADILLVTGPVTRQSLPRLKRVYDQMSENKKVIGIGICPINGGPFRGSYNIKHSLKDVIPVDKQVEGCPPRPEAIIQAIVELIEEER